MSLLRQLVTYPIKSCAGINLETSEVFGRGLALDRRWLLIEDNGDFVSQRTSPLLGQIKLSVQNEQLKVSYPDKDSLFLDLNVTGSTHRHAKIWKDQVKGLWLNQDYDDWFSAILGRQVHLLHMNQTVQRPLIKESLPANQNFEVSFADGYPYLLTSDASLADLNQRLALPIPMDRFRANLVVNGFEAYAEDYWKQIRIGDVEFLVVKPCARCQVTTIDQSTGKYSKEPLKTLASYRKKDGKVMFGMNLVALNGGRVSIGDPVHILK